MKPRFRKRQQRRERRRALIAVERILGWHDEFYSPCGFRRRLVTRADRTHYIRTGEWPE